MVDHRHRFSCPSASGRRPPEPIEGSEFTLDVDMVIQAIGTNPNPLPVSLIPGLARGRRGERRRRRGRPDVHPPRLRQQGHTTGAAAMIDAMLKGE